MPAATRLRQLLTGPELVVAPGVYDAITARLAQQAGFAALYTRRHATGWTTRSTANTFLVPRSKWNRRCCSCCQR